MCYLDSEMTIISIVYNKERNALSLLVCFAFRRSALMSFLWANSSIGISPYNILKYLGMYILFLTDILINWNTYVPKKNYLI